MIPFSNFHFGPDWNPDSRTVCVTDLKWMLFKGLLVYDCKFEKFHPHLFASTINANGSMMCFVMCCGLVGECGIHQLCMYLNAS